MEEVFSFKGKIKRKEFILFGLIFPNLIWLAIIVGIKFSGGCSSDNCFYFIAFLGITLGIWINIAATVKRLRDIGWSIWWIILMFLPYVNLIFIIILMIKPSKVDYNKIIK